MARQCKAKSKSTGKRCQRAPINGAAVCRVHGGAAPQVKAKAEERIAEYVRKMVDPQRLLQEAARLAYADMTQLYNEDGELLPMKDWPEHMKGAVGNIETVRRNIDHADGQTDQVLKVKAWDKLKALEMLFKNMGLLTERLEHSGALEVRWKD